MSCEPSQSANYRFMMYLRKLYHTPGKLLYSKVLSISRKQDLLKKWREKREEYIFTNCRDYDYICDEEIADLAHSVKIVKALIKAQEANQIPVNIYSQRDSENTKKQEP